MAVRSLELSLSGRWKKPFVASNMEKCFTFLSLKLISSRVLELQTGLTIYLFKSVRSKQILKSPLGFLTIMNEFNHSFAVFLSSLEMILCCSIEWTSSSNFPLSETGTCWAGFYTRIAFSESLMSTGQIRNLPTPEKALLKWEPLSNLSLSSAVLHCSSQLSKQNSV